TVRGEARSVVHARACRAPRTTCRSRTSPHGWNARCKAAVMATRSFPTERRAVPRVDRTRDAQRASKRGGSVSETFQRVACAISNKMGTHWAFMGALALVIGWAITGPFFHYSETWQLVINTGTTI